MNRRNKTIDIFIRISISIMILIILFFLAKIILKYVDLDIFSKENIQKYIESTGIFAPIV